MHHQAQFPNAFGIRVILGGGYSEQGICDLLHPLKRCVSDEELGEMLRIDAHQLVLNYIIDVPVVGYFLRREMLISR